VIRPMTIRGGGAAAAATPIRDAEGLLGWSTWKTGPGTSGDGRPARTTRSFSASVAVEGPSRSGAGVAGARGGASVGPRDLGRPASSRGGAGRSVTRALLVADGELEVASRTVDSVTGGSQRRASEAGADSRMRAGGASRGCVVDARPAGAPRGAEA
jgi:hypothetical protein